jgi:arylsulfatase A-like enzyme
VGKWNAYDPSLRVPMFMRGPGIAKGKHSALLGSHVDLAPTWLGLAGLDTPPEMDGRSLVRDIVDPSAPGVSESTKQHAARLSAAEVAGNVTAGYRPQNAVFVSYHGLGPVGAPHRWMDSLNNTYRILRYMNDAQYGDLMYAEFAGDFNFDTVVFHGRQRSG